MWQLVFPDKTDRVTQSCLEAVSTIQRAMDDARYLNRTNTCRYELMKVSDLPLLRGPSLPELIASGKIPQPCFRMLKADEKDGWTDPKVIAQLREHDHR